MNKVISIIVLLTCWSCGGKLSDEQRKKLHDGMATQEIKRVSESDVQAAALVLAKSIYADVEKVDKTLKNKPKIDSLASVRQVKIYTLVPDDKMLREIEKSLVDAYINGTGNAQPGDNLQRVGEDSLLYTKPIFKERPDGSQQFSHAVGIKMSKRTVVSSIPSI